VNNTTIYDDNTLTRQSRFRRFDKLLEQRKSKEGLSKDKLKISINKQIVDRFKREFGKKRNTIIVDKDYNTE